MLPPDSRAVLLQELRPPPGHKLDAAIATTFTLDLTAAVLPPLAFSSFATSSSLPDPVTLLEAVRSAADRVDIFCQGGNIIIPPRAPDLLAFVEPMIHEVRRPGGHLFHPKVWFVRYVDGDGNESYRLLVLTRNLTNDRAWDIVVRLDSADISRRQLPENRDLSAFLADLPGRVIAGMPKHRRQRVETLAHAALYVIWEKPADAHSVSLHYLNGSKHPDLGGRRHLVVSPFLNDDGLGLIGKPDQKVMVLSRAEELERLSPKTLARLDTFVLDAMAGIATDDERPGQDDTPLDTPEERAQPAPGLLSGLHAKLFVIEPWGRAQRARLLVGSTNATSAAFGGNVEFLVEFEGPRKVFGVEALMGEEGTMRPLIEAYQAAGGAEPDPQQDEKRDLENRLRTIAEIRHTLTVTPGDTGPDEPQRYDVAVTTARAYPLIAGWSASIELLTHPGVARQVVADKAVSDMFSDLPTADISPFVSVRLTSPSALQGGTVVLADLVGDPEDRLDLVLARQIDTPEKFLRFLYLILSLGNPHLLAYLGSLDGSDKNGKGIRPGGGPGILELVLRALADKPAALEDLGRLVERMLSTEEGRKLLPEGFEELWQAATKARHMLSKVRR